MSSEMPRTKVNYKVVNRLWGVAAGRCEMCNRLLYADPTFGTSGNYAENAHIHGVGKNGPRHKASMTDDEINAIDNLMLLCSGCHKTIDDNPEPTKIPSRFQTLPTDGFFTENDTFFIRFLLFYKTDNTPIQIDFLAGFVSGAILW
ncbi:MAG: hypothetical protein LBL86_00335 [Coriobacteriales bacterium]|jgi:hypothetical protein|nr:hypothetical protein [Coriobacteriales bacterium]